MMLEELLKHPANVTLQAAFDAAGVPLYVVGGPVRDALSGRVDYSDLDYTTPARPEETLRVVSPLGPTWVIGMEFGTVCVQVAGTKVEITTHRTEAYEPGSRKPLVVFGDTIADDLKRRDLTINAMAVCLVADGTYRPGDLVDLYGGAEDLRSGTIRTPDDPLRTMDEDPLRMVRAIRFAVRRSMQVDASLVTAIRSQVGRLSIVSTERFTEELRKVALGGPRQVTEAFDLAASLDVLPYWVKDLSQGWPAARSTTADLEGDLLDVLAVLAFHAPGVDLAQVLRDLRLSTEESRVVLRTHRLLQAVPTDRLAARHLVRSESDDSLQRLRRAATVEGIDFSVVDAVWGSEAWVRSALSVTGDDLLALGLQGREVGTMLRRLLDLYLSREGVTRDDLLALVRG